MSVLTDNQPESPAEVTQPPDENKFIVRATRKKRAPKHDFKNGCGRVFAHKHDNGGGWVADSARVEDEAYVGAHCEVFEYACVSGKVKMEGRVRVHGHASVHGDRIQTGILLRKNAQIYGRAIVRDNVTMSDDSRALGNACISGTTRMHHNCSVADSAQIISSTLADNSNIRGGALIVRSHISQTATVVGNAVVTNSTINGSILVRDFGQILNSRVENFDNAVTTVVMDHAVVLDDSRIHFPVVFKQHAAIIHTQFVRGYQSEYANPVQEIGGNTIMSRLTFRNVSEIQAYLERINNHSSGLPPIAAAPNTTSRRINYFETSRNGRRVMTLQETTA